MKLSELTAALKELNASPSKSLGQNFLHDQNLASWTVDQAEIQPDDAWLEIGPGLGSLTVYALARSQRGILIEKDDRLIAHLQARFPDLQTVHGDACSFDIRNLLPLGPLKVFGNLPYYVSSQIIFNFTSAASPVTRMVFTLQKEMAERLAAEPSTKDYGAPTLLIGRRWRVQLLRVLPPSVFLPAPKVDSAVVTLSPRQRGELPDCSDARFEQLVKLGFSQRRKQLGKLISGALPEWRAAFDQLGFEHTVRAEALSLEQWCNLAAWTPNRPKSHLGQDSEGERFDIVNESDEVVGNRSRRETHAEGLRHRAVHIFIFNKMGEIFLQRRSRWKDVAPLTWDSSAAGHVDSGCDYDETAPRELREELGIEVNLAAALKIDSCPGTGNEFVTLYIGSHQGPFQLSPSEIECGEWFGENLLQRWINARPGDFAPGFLECWKAWNTLDPARRATLQSGCEK